MLEWLANASPLEILIAILAFIVLWIIIRIVLKLAIKIFACGCVMILLLGVALFAANYFLGPNFSFGP
ncbi:MAG: hypothetical protein OHK0052_19510 [Anaerolineales bacterium]